MRRVHFDTIRPICPRCRAERDVQAPIILGQVIHEEDGQIVEGLMHCPEEVCRQEYPIIDGIPILMPYVRRFVADHIEQLNARRDLSATIESLLGDCAGPGSVFDYTRQQVSSYAWDHYGEFDPDESAREETGSSTACLRTLVERAGEPFRGPGHGPMLDLGCATGRHAFELAGMTDGLVLGIDASFAMLQVATGVLRTGGLTYPRRRIGLAYDRRSFPVSFDGAERVDFWLCDAQALPLRDESCRGIVGLNVLDAVAAPFALLQSIARVLRQNGLALLACPYDWSGGATPPEAWIGGHSQRGDDRGDAPARLRETLASAELKRLRLADEIDDLVWRLRLHERSTTEYRLHGVILRA